MPDRAAKTPAPQQPSHKAPEKPAPRKPSSMRLQRKCGCQGGGSAGGGGDCSCDSKKKLQRHALGERMPAAIPREVDSALATPGTPLDADTRAFMESRFRHDFGAVRVHTGALAASSADAVTARAYTIGSDIVFAANAYTPGNNAGRRLLAHELTHVVQQSSGGAAMQASSPISTPGEASEVEADRVADSVMSGGAFRIGSASGPQLQRTVSASISECTTPNASACLIHLHQNEQNAFESAQTVFQERCVNLVTLGRSNHRCIQVTTSAGNCSFDPNRIFSTDDVTLDHAFDTRDASQGCDPGTAAARAAALPEIRTWRDTQLMAAINRCRNSIGIGTSLPIVAMHNNTPGALSVESYRPRTDRSGRFLRHNTESRSTESNPDVLRDPITRAPRTNPSVPPAAAPAERRDPDQFLVVTDPADFHAPAIRDRFNVALQARRPVDDGSLSVALRDQRYINVEAEPKPHSTRAPRGGGRPSPFDINVGMAREILDHLRVPLRGVSVTRCSGTMSTPACDAQAAQQARTAQQAQTAGSPARPLEETLPSGLPPNCRTFASRSELEAVRNDWFSRISGMPPADVVRWAVGGAVRNSVVVAARDEAARQRRCMLRAMEIESRRPGSALSLEADARGGRMLAPESAQRRIWMRKWRFDRGTTPDTRVFDRITNDAASHPACASHGLTAGGQWDTHNAGHRACWTLLRDDPVHRNWELLSRQILQASSAPGISRHHWGTDFDFGGIQAADWLPGAGAAAAGRYFDEHRWLGTHGGIYGFSQAYTVRAAPAAFGGTPPPTMPATRPRLPGGEAYMEERWHWSYWPVGQALTEWITSHDTLVETELDRLWDGRTAAERRRGDPHFIAPQFRFIRDHWREYVFGVNTQPPLD